MDDIAIDVVTSLPVDVPYAEDFELGLGDWSVDNGMWEVGEPTVGPSEAYSGVNVGGTVLAGNYPGNDSRLVSPSVQLPVLGAGEVLQLRFWHWFSIQGNDGGHVQVSEQTGPGEWSAWETLSTYRNASSVWTRPLVDLSGYAGKQVRIAFLLDYGCCGASNGWYVDDVVVEKF